MLKGYRQEHNQQTHTHTHTKHNKLSSSSSNSGEQTPAGGIRPVPFLLFLFYNPLFQKRFHEICGDSAKSLVSPWMRRKRRPCPGTHTHTHRAAHTHVRTRTSRHTPGTLTRTPRHQKTGKAACLLYFPSGKKFWCLCRTVFAKYFGCSVAFQQEPK